MLNWLIRTDDTDHNVQTATLRLETLESREVPAILNHCRRPAEHVRGCWVVDLVLDKD